MRHLLIVPVLLLAACNVSHDQENGSTTVAFDANTAENGLEAAANEAQEIGGIIANDVSQTADKVQNEVGDVDVDVDVGGNEGAPANSN